jgi:hypothetical protein
MVTKNSDSKESWNRLGVIDSLSAGFRFLGGRLELLAIPVVLDLLLWLAPHFSIATMTTDLAGWYRTMSAVEGMPADASLMTQQVAESVEMFGGDFNLLASLVSSTLLHVPSLMVNGVQASSMPVVEVTTPAEAFVLWLVFSLVGLLIGVVYLGLLARRLPIGGGATLTIGEFMTSIIRQWLQVIAFVVIVILVLLMIYIPLSVGVSLLALVSPALGSFLAVASGSLSLLLFFYLYFATAGIVMDNLSAPEALKRSIRVVRTNFLATLGFVTVSTLIGLGISLLMLQLADVAPWAVTPAILLNAYVGVGLSMAMLIFYRTRYLASDAELVR